MSNFVFLKPQWPDLYAEAAQAERLAHVDPRVACFYARRALELSVAWLYDADVMLERPYRNDLAAMIDEPTMTRLVGPAVRTKMDLIRRQGNIAVHRKTLVSPNDAVRTIGELFHVMYWLARTYAQNAAEAPAAGLVFDQAALLRPVPAAVRIKQQSELQELARQNAEKDAALAAARRKNEDLDGQLAALRAQIAAAKKANASRADTHDYNEAETRANLIDLVLKEAGWRLDQERDREFPVTGLPEAASKSGNGFVDYVLWDDDGKPLGLVEAKRTTHDVYKGQHQAKLYADCLEAMFGQRPVIFYTNGYEIHLWDDVNYPPRPVRGYFTKEELRLLVQRRTSRLKLVTLQVNSEIAGRAYQERAIRRIAEAFEQDHRRRALLVMATGAGKTRTVIGLVDLLARGNWVKRVLFLADRRTLVRQAARAFTRHLPGLTTVNVLEGKRDLNARVLVSTYPTLMNMINEGDGDLRRFGPGYFDLIVVDEAHRSIYQKYGAIFDYFDAPLVGLTATPKDEVDRNTYRLFQLEDGVPTDVYSLEDAIDEHYLVPPTAIDVPLKFQRGGIRYADLSEADKARWEEADWGDDGQVPGEITPAELNKYLFNADTVDKALATLMTNGVRVAGGDRLGKTIIFAKNKDHANFIFERFNLAYPEYRGDFAQVITHDKDFAESLIDQFSQPEKDPHIAISVDMLDTGVDVPEVVNLVFFKLVRSKTKYWQMIGRGTRLCPDLHGPGRDKQGFLIFDLCQNIEFFNQAVSRVEGKIPKPLGQRLFEHRVDLLAALDRQPAEPDSPDAELRDSLAQRLHGEVSAMNRNNFLVRPKLEHVDVYSAFEPWRSITPEVRDRIVENLADLPTAYREPQQDNSEEAKRFDLLALRLQLAVLNAEPGYARLRDQVREIAATLLDQTTIPAVRVQQELLDELTTDAWWQDVTLPMLETIRKRVRGLVKLIEKTKRAVVYTDIEDELGDLQLAELQGVHLGTDWAKFEAKARTYMRTHEDQLAVQKIYRNKQITTADLSVLEQVFIEIGIGTDADIERAGEKADGFGLFLRSLTGLDREAAVAALSEFHGDAPLAGNQLHFLNLMIDNLTRNGTLDIDALYQPPFTDHAPRGPEALFTEAKIDVLVSALHGIRATAIPQEQVA